MTQLIYQKFMFLTLMITSLLLYTQLIRNTPSCLTLWQHKVIKNLAAIEAEKVDIIALALAKDKIQEIVEA